MIRGEPPAIRDTKLLAVLLPRGKRLGTATISELKAAARVCTSLACRLTRLAEAKRAPGKVVAQPPVKAPGDPFKSDDKRKQAIRDSATYLRGRQRDWLRKPAAPRVGP